MFGSAVFVRPALAPCGRIANRRSGATVAVATFALVCAGGCADARGARMPIDKSGWEAHRAGVDAGRLTLAVRDRDQADLRRVRQRRERPRASAASTPPAEVAADAPAPLALILRQRAAAAHDWSAMPALQRIRMLRGDPDPQVGASAGDIAEAPPRNPSSLLGRYEQSLVKPVGNCQELATVDPRVRQIANDAAAHFGGAALAISCYRSLAYNRAVYHNRCEGGVCVGDGSQHIRHRALDFQIRGVPPFRLAAWVRQHPLMRTIGGVGLYCGDFIHIDVGAKRNWNWCGDELADGTRKHGRRYAAKDRPGETR